MRMPIYNQALFIFRRDLRLDDNTGLSEALEKSKTVIPCFIFDPTQIDTKKNEYKSDNCMQFMIESLIDLDKQLKAHHSRLFYFFGKPDQVIQQLIKQNSLDAIFINEDYTPFSQERDKALKNICKQEKVAFHSFCDSMLHGPQEVLTTTKRPYQVFTAYYKKARTLPVSTAHANKYTHYFAQDKKLTQEISLKKIEKYYNHNSQILTHGGRSAGLTILKNLKHFNSYNKNRNNLTYATTHLSPYNKFGCISIREVHHQIKKALAPDNDLMKQLYWRDFFYALSFHFSYVYGSAFKKELNKLTWSKNNHYFELWCQGKTGFPLVDACMRELNTTGYMHNRGRLIAASFLIKDLHCDWQKGERYFANKLVDYDPAQNNGNWQWVASTGADHSPYFRIFNPWLQQAKFDPDCLYIKRWIPELSAISNKVIHSLHNQEALHIKNYPSPIVSHSIESQKSKLMYKNI